MPAAAHRPARSLALAGALAATLALPTAAAVRLGTPNPETLTGTHQADLITGGAGNDTLRGLAGDDTYHFADGWGAATLEEKRAHRVGGKKLPGGRDTLSFRGVTGGGVEVRLNPEWRGVNPAHSGASGPGGERVDLGAALVEDAVGTRGFDSLGGGGAANRLATGGGGDDFLSDLGGWDDGAGGNPELPASSDAYRGAAANTGTVSVTDWGGPADVLDVRPLRSDDVYLARVDCDGTDPERECLQVVTGTTATSQVVVAGQFGAYENFTGATGQRGRIETVLFADGSVGFGGAEVGATAEGGGRDGEALLGKPTTERQRRLAKRAPALAEAARREAADLPAPGAPPD